MQTKNINILIRQQKDALILQAAPAKGDDFKLTKLACFIRDDGVELYQYEGKPILEIHPPELSSTQADDSYTITATHKFKILTE